MGFLYLVIATLSWSLVGVLVKTASFQFDPYTITFARFSIGVLALAALILATRGKLKPAGFSRWIWIGAIGKSANYLFENIAVSIGYSYGNILVPPTQTIVLLFVSMVLFKERLTPKNTISAGLVLLGVALITMNGRPIGELFGTQGWISLLFVLAGIGAAFHFVSQKMLLDSMSDVSMNYSIFFWASLMTAIPLPFATDWQPTFVPGAWLAAIALGLITGLSFYLSSKALRTVKFSVAVVVTNLSVLFTVLWAAVFFRDPITPYIIAGAVVVVAGMTLLNWPSRGRVREAAE
ncbi:DMT family transporter [Paenibacillus sp. TRM 82003]|nr:DMT family transporter [Paenibacillus sp. TRM 82003]